MAELWFRRRGARKGEPVDDLNPLPVAEQRAQRWVPFASETLTIAATALAFTAATYAPPGESLDLRVETGPLESGQVRYWYDGTAPTATVGQLLEIGDRLVIEGLDSIVGFRAIRTGGVSGSLPITYLKRERQ